RPRHRSTRRDGSRRSPPSSRTRRTRAHATNRSKRMDRVATVLPPHARLRPPSRPVCPGIPARRNDHWPGRNARRPRGVPRTRRARVFALHSPWTIPEFEPLGRVLVPLLLLEDRLTTRDGLVLTESRFLIEARKPSKRFASLSGRLGEIRGCNRFGRKKPHVSYTPGRYRSLPGR